MRYGLDVPTTGEFADPRALATLAAEAETAGWDGFFVWDVLLGSADGVAVADPWITLAAIALATTRMRIGPLATPLARHRPWLVARQIATLDHLSAGRVTLAAGLGFSPRDFTAFNETDAPATRARALDEGLDVLAGLLRGERFSYQGEHYTVDGVLLSPAPVQAHVPLWVAGGWPHTAPFRRAARWDGACVKSWNQAQREPLSAEDFRACAAYTQARRAELGATGPFDMIASGESPSDPDVAGAAIRPYRDAGATWWVEEGFGWTYDEFRARVLAGPPRL